MTRPMRRSRPPLGGWLPCPARVLSSLAVVAAVVAGLLAGLPTTPAQAAGWTTTVTRSAPLTAATVASSWQKLNAAGTVSTDGTAYSFSGFLTGTVTGYVDLVNTSTVAAKPSLTVAMGSLVGATPAAVCSQAWNTSTGDCPGTTTMVALTVVLGTATGSYTSPDLLPPGGHVFVKVALAGVAATVTLTRGTTTPRPAADRTTS